MAELRELDTARALLRTAPVRVRTSVSLNVILGLVNNES